MSNERPIDITPEVITKFPVEEILVAGNRGPCGGVNMALEAVNQVLNIVAGRETVYTNWDIVNNRPIMEELKSRGLVSFRNDWSLVPDETVVFFSAHGIPPYYHEIAKRKNLLVIDVTCQLVTRVHNLVKKADREGKHIIYIGVNRHPETVGVIGEVDPKNITLVQDINDVENLRLSANKNKVVYSQTTLLPDEVVEIEQALQQEVPQTEVPNRLDICYAMFNRQAAVEQLLQKGIDCLLVVGSKHSHNSQELRHKGEKAGIPAFSVDRPEEIDIEWFTGNIRTVGLTAGASVLERFTEDVLSWFKWQNPAISISFDPQVIPEREMTFKLPKESIKALSSRYAT